MQIKSVVSGIAALALVAGLAVNASADEKGKPEKSLALTDTPVAVQAAIKQFAGSNAIEKITKESEDNTVIYEASVKIDGAKQAIEVLADCPEYHATALAEITAASHATRSTLAVCTLVRGATHGLSVPQGTKCGVRIDAKP